jgi:hypothetical protein
MHVELLSLQVCFCVLILLWVDVVCIVDTKASTGSYCDLCPVTTSAVLVFEPFLWVVDINRVIVHHPYSAYFHALYHLHAIYM